MSTPKVMSHQEGDEIILKCKGDKRTIRANKSVLAKHSKYFEGISSFADKVAEFDPRIVPFDILARVVDYIEKGVVKHAVMDEVEQLLAAADYLQADFVISSLICFLHLEAERWMQDWDNLEMKKQDLLILLRLYQTLYRYEADVKFPHKIMKIEQRTRSSRDKSISSMVCVCPKFIIAMHFKRLMNELAVLQLDEDILGDLLSCDHLRLSEEEVMRVVKMWCYYAFEERKEAFERVVKCVRVNNHSISTKFVMDELTCNCRTPCDCLTSKDFVISMLSHRLHAASSSKSGGSTLQVKDDRAKLKRRSSSTLNLKQG